MSASLLLLLLLAPFFSAPLVLLLGPRLGPRVGWVALVTPLAGLASCLALSSLPHAERAVTGWDWVSRLGVKLSFTCDGLALFYGFLVTGIGSLVTFYAIYYLDEHYRDHGRFYFLLQLFTGTMLVSVFSSDLLVLFTAWELTGVTSFFLIGFLYDQADSRRGARMALLTTAATGLALLVGIVLLRHIFGTFELSRMLVTPVPEEQRSLLGIAFGCCFLGICGKSALFPFSYWLPNAMAAPTPVSAYLHSATMVKLGVFLSARLLPVFVGAPGWTQCLLSVGFATYALAALFAWLSYDLKAVLAYTTVAQLGLLVGQYGFAVPGEPIFGDLLHVLNHSLYKACLFMVVGIIDHSTGGRDLRGLGGLLQKMPLTAVIAMIGLAALVGVPFTSGFVSKELLIDTALAYGTAHPTLLGAWPLASFIFGSIVQVVVVLRIVRWVFFGRLPEQIEANFRSPSLGMQLPPLLLALAVLLFGVWPSAFARVSDAFAVSHSGPLQELSLWHGWTPTLMVSASVFLSGGLLFWLVLNGRSERFAAPRWALDLDRTFDRVVEGLPALGQRADRALGFHRPSLYLTITVMFSVMVWLTYLDGARGLLVPAIERAGNAPAGPEAWGRWGVVTLVSTATLFAAAWRRPIPQLFAVSLVGYAVAVYYVLYRAPDLALTQLLVEAATLILVLLVVLRLKRDGAEHEAMPPPSPSARLARVTASAGAGLALGLGVLLFRSDLFPYAGAYYLGETVPLAHGRNAVNTVVVDFRGFDTMLEITVLVIATLGCLGLLFRPSGSQSSQLPLSATDLFPVPFDLILKVVVIGAFLPLNVFSLYMFFRGHNAPGGGFVAGLVSALSLVLLSFVLGVEGFRRIFRVPPMLLAVAGVALSMLVMLLPLVFGYAPLHHLYVSIGKFRVGTPLLFDLGVFLTVIGVALKLILPLMKSVHGLPAFVREEEGRFAGAMNEPIDFDPERHLSFPPSTRS